MDLPARADAALRQLTEQPSHWTGTEWGLYQSGWCAYQVAYGQPDGDFCRAPIEPGLPYCPRHNQAVARQLTGTE